MKLTPLDATTFHVDDKFVVRQAGPRALARCRSPQIRERPGTRRMGMAWARTSLPSCSALAMAAKASRPPCDETSLGCLSTPLLQTSRWNGWATRARIADFQSRGLDGAGAMVVWPKDAPLGVKSGLLEAAVDWGQVGDMLMFQEEDGVAKGRRRLFKTVEL